MSQFMRPSEDINTGWAKSTGGSCYGCIDEESYSDSDYISTTSSAYQECKLSAPAGTPGSGFSKLSYRVKKGSITDNVTFSVSIRQGSTEITSSGSVTLYITFKDKSHMFSLGSITDWSDVRVRFTATISGLNSVAVSWAQLNVPDPPIASGLEMGMMF